MGAGAYKVFVLSHTKRADFNIFASPPPLFLILFSANSEIPLYKILRVCIRVFR